MRTKIKILLFIAIIAAILLATCDDEPDGPEDEPPVLDKISIRAIQGVTQPVNMAAPVTAITANEEYTGTVSWSPEIEDGKFAADTQYTATITLTPKDGFTLQGVSSNYFTVAFSSTTTNAANSGIITAVFPKTLGATVTITQKDIPGVTAPETGYKPVLSVSTPQYTGTVSWSPKVAENGVFNPCQQYIATITLTPNVTPENTFTMEGITRIDFFTVAGALPVNYDLSDKVTAVFKETEPLPNNFTVQFTNKFDDEIIDFGDIDLVTRYGKIRIAESTGFDDDDYVWYVDGMADGGGITVTKKEIEGKGIYEIAPDGLWAPGRHTLTAVVYKEEDGIRIPYSKTVYFKVEVEP